MAKVIKGRTEDAEAPFLGADFWTPGTVVKGFVERSFKTKMDEGKESENYVLVLNEPVEVEKEECERVCVGGLTGFRMALTACKPPYLLKPGDYVELECTGKQSPKKAGHSARINFQIEITPGPGYFGEKPMASAAPQEPDWMR